MHLTTIYRNLGELVADARHSWLDALSSAGALAGLVAVAAGQRWGDPEPAGGAGHTCRAERGRYRERVDAQREDETPAAEARCSPSHAGTGHRQAVRFVRVSRGRRADVARRVTRRLRSLGCRCRSAAQALNDSSTSCDCAAITGSGPR